MLRHTIADLWSYARNFGKRPRAKTDFTKRSIARHGVATHDRIRKEKFVARIGHEEREENVRRDAELATTERAFRRIAAEMASGNNSGGGGGGRSSNAEQNMAASRKALQLSLALKAERKSQRSRHFFDARTRRDEFLRENGWR